MRAALVVSGAVLAVLVAGSGEARAETALERRLRQLEETVQQQQQEIRGLRRELEHEKTSGKLTEQKAETTKQQVETAAKAWTAPDWLKRVTLFGDMRFRFEGFYNQPSSEGTKVTANNRERIRARIGLKFAPTDEVAFTVRATSGNPNDPISTNETLTGDFTRKHVNLDWAFLTVTPGKTFGWRPGVLTVNAGKFPVPMFRTDEMVWDDDLSPEGTSETIAFLGAPCGNLDQLKLHLVQWTYQQTSNGPDGWVIGGQFNPQMHIGQAQVEAGIGQYYYLNPNLIATQLSSNSSLINTNLVVTNSDGDITGYQGGFNITNATAAVTWPDVVVGQPLRVYGDWVYNWQAPTNDYMGVLGGFRLGQTRVRGDWSVTALYEYLQQESTISVFSWSDFGNGGTNQKGPMIALDYQLFDPLTVSARSWFTNYIQTPPGKSNPTQTRLQLDAVVKF